jgi:hypothetical protein
MSATGQTSCVADESERGLLPELSWGSGVSFLTNLRLRLPKEQVKECTFVTVPPVWGQGERKCLPKGFLKDAETGLVYSVTIDRRTWAITVSGCDGKVFGEDAPVDASDEWLNSSYTLNPPPSLSNRAREAGTSSSWLTRRFSRFRS